MEQKFSKEEAKESFNMLKEQWKDTIGKFVKDIRKDASAEELQSWEDLNEVAEGIFELLEKHEIKTEKPFNTDAIYNHLLCVPAGMLSIILKSQDISAARQITTSLFGITVAFMANPKPMMPIFLEVAEGRKPLDS